MMNAHGQAQQITAMIERALIGQHRACELTTLAFLAGGHLLIEDVPGIGKTTLARALAKAAGGEFRRIQFTSDLLPADITGVSVFENKTSEFKFKPGPIFSNFVLADEINRATPKTQSALLEAMSENRVSVDGVSRTLPWPFMVIATKNAEEHHGTYPLPESQLDRFLLRISLGYPGPVEERQVIARPTLADPVETIEPVLTPTSATTLTEAVDRVRVDPTLVDFIMAIIERTRTSPSIELGVGPRGGMALHRASRALAILRGRDYCLADDIKELAVPVLSHRIIVRGAAWHHGNNLDAAKQAIAEVAAAVEIPF